MISHIGIAVADLEKALRQYRLLTGRSETLTKEVADQKVKVAVFHAEGGSIELVSPTASDSPVASFLKKRGEGLHHICLYVDDIESTLAELKKKGVRLIDETPRIGAEGKKIAFVHPASTHGVLIELEER